MISAVIFDIDGVLIDSFDANLTFYQDLFVYAGYKPISREAFLTMNHMTMMEVIRNVTGLKNEDEVKKIWQMGKDKVIQYPYELITATEGMEKTIIGLSKKYILAIVTSRLRGSVTRLPQLAHLETYFQTIVYFEDTKKHKPNPEPLLLATEKLRVDPKACVYVGDTESDMQAAHAAGMRGILYLKNNKIKSNNTISKFRILPQLIQMIR